MFTITDDVVYNQSVNATSTLDKRRPDLRDELGYIAPPNRKLPPVPGSNYNTCDRIKRGTVLSKKLLEAKACNEHLDNFKHHHHSFFVSSLLLLVFPIFFPPRQLSGMSVWLLFVLLLCYLVIIRTTLSFAFHMGSKETHVRRVEQPEKGLKRHDAFA